MSLRRRVGNFWIRFRLGYTIYLSLPLGLITLIITVYYLAIPNLPWLSTIFPTISIFAFIVTIIIILFGYKLGDLHLSKRTMLYRQEAVATTLANPYNYNLLVPVWVPLWEAQAELCRKLGLYSAAEKIDETLARSRAAYKYDLKEK